jgi:acyl-CoA reductase-like NAD-dependent aldehyde dehydrogenase
MIEVVQAFDRAPIARLDSDDAAALDRKIEAARRVFENRHAWLKPHRRIEILRKLAVIAGRRESGYGVGGIPWTMQEMTEKKMIVFRM